MTFPKILLLLALATTPASPTRPNSAFHAIGPHYESIRLSLLEDSMDGVEEHAAAIERAIRELAGDPSPGAAAVAEGDYAQFREFLPRLSKHSAALAKAEKIDSARDALGELTKPLVRWRELVEGARPVVAYCPMVKKAWLQPDGPIGNPYGGKAMPRCGSIVER